MAHYCVLGLRGLLFKPLAGARGLKNKHPQVLKHNNVPLEVVIHTLHNAYIILISYIMTKKIIAIIEKLYFMLNK